MRRICLLVLAAGGLFWGLAHPALAADVKDVLGACDRTPGCNYSTNKAGDVTGCSANACFYCANDGKRQCTGVTKARTAGKGSKGQVGQIAIGGVKLDPAAKSSKAAKAIAAQQAAAVKEKKVQENKTSTKTVAKKPQGTAAGPDVQNVSQGHKRTLGGGKRN